MAKIGTLFRDGIVDAGGWPVPRPAKHEPVPAEVQTTALARFVGAIGESLKADALAVLSIVVKPVETVEAASKLADQRAGVKLLLKDIEDRRKRTVEPIKKEAAAVDAEAHRWADPLVAWDKKAEQALLAFKRLDEDRKRRELEERQKAVVAASQAQTQAEEAGDMATADAASVALMKAEAAPVEAPVRGFKTDSGTTSLRTVWKVEIVDPALVPDAYLVPDLRLLQKAVDAGAREIAGCHIQEVESLVVRTRG